MFRHEPSGDPARLQMFHQREMVRLGEPETVIAWRDGWRDRAISLLRVSDWMRSFDVAADPFFGRQGRMLAASQREQALKFEVLVQIAGDEPTAVASFNYHHDHFTADRTGSAMAGGHVAHTACLGFGLERITLALFHTHGLDAARWPDPVRAEIGLRMTAVSSRLGRPVRAGSGDLPPASAPRRRPLLPETNCYADVIIELLHARGDEPLAAMGTTARLDFEGDQWTFFKPDPADLEALFGVDIHEMQPYRPIPVVIAELLAVGPDDDRRAGCLVPAGHGLDVLPDRARQDDDHPRGDRPGGGAAAVLPQQLPVRPGRETTTAASSGSTQSSPRHFRRTRSSCASTPARG